MLCCSNVMHATPEPQPSEPISVLPTAEPVENPFSELQSELRNTSGAEAPLPSARLAATLRMLGRQT